MYYVFMNDRVTRHTPRREEAISKATSIVRSHETQTAYISQDGKLPFMRIHMTDYGPSFQTLDREKELQAEIDELEDAIDRFHDGPKKRKKQEELRALNERIRDERSKYRLGVIAYNDRKSADTEKAPAQG